jgi:hypothetical protein
MTATNQDVRLTKGDARAIVIPLESPDETEITVSAATWWLGKALNSTGADVVLSKSLGSGITLGIDDDDVPFLTVSITGANTSSLTPGTFYHQARITDISGKSYTVTTGKFVLGQTMAP